MLPSFISAKQMHFIKRKLKKGGGRVKALSMLNPRKLLILNSSALV